MNTQYAAIWEKRTGPAWQARHGLSEAKFVQEIGELQLKNYWPVKVSGYNVDNTDTFAAIWEEFGLGSTGREVVQGITAAAYQEAFDNALADGLRLVDVSGYSIDGEDHYVATFSDMPGPDWIARHGLSAAEYQQEFDTLAGQGYRLVDVGGYNVMGEDRYAAIWQKSQGPAWVARHGLSAAEYQQEFDILVGQGYRLTSVRGWPSGDGTLYAAIWVQRPGPNWVARHGLSAAEYQQEFDTLVGQGYRLIHVSGY